MACNKSNTGTVAKVANAAKNNPNLSKISSFSSWGGCHICKSPPAIDRFGFPHFYEHEGHLYCGDCVPPLPYRSPWEYLGKPRVKAAPIPKPTQRPSASEYHLMLDALTETHHTLNELCSMLEMDKAKARATISELRADGYPLECWREGRHYFYAIDTESANHAG